MNTEEIILSWKPLLLRKRYLDQQQWSSKMWFSCQYQSSIQSYRLELSADTGRSSWVQSGGVLYCCKAFTPVSVHISTARLALKTTSNPQPPQQNENEQQWHLGMTGSLFRTWCISSLLKTAGSHASQYTFLRRMKEVLPLESSWQNLTDSVWSIWNPKYIYSSLKKKKKKVSACSPKLLEQVCPVYQWTRKLGSEEYLSCHTQQFYMLQRSTLQLRVLELSYQNIFQMREDALPSGPYCCNYLKKKNNSVISKSIGLTTGGWSCLML